MGKTTDELNASDRGDLEMTSAERFDGDDSAGYIPAGGTMSEAYQTAPVAGYDSEYTDTVVTRSVDDDGGTTPEIDETRHQIEQTRADMSRTIDAIQEKLSPANIAQQAKDTVRDATVGKAQEMVSNAGEAAAGVVNDTADTARGFGYAIIDTIRENPIPAALTGLGIGWLFMSRRNHQPHSTTRTGYVGGYDRTGYAGGYDRYGYSGDEQYRGYNYAQARGAGYTGPEYSGNNGPGRLGQVAGAAGSAVSNAGGAAGSAVGQVADTAGNVAGQVADTAGNVAGQVQDAAGNLAGNVAGTATHLANQAQYNTRSAARNLSSLMRENPLGVSVAAVAVGMAVGLAIPETEKENELMGEARDSVMQQAQQTVQDTAQKVQAVAQEAVGAAKDAATESAQNQGLTGESN